MNLLCWASRLAVFVCVLPALASAEALPLSARGQIEVAFTPGDDAASLIQSHLAKARRQILVQAYSFTHKALAESLVAAQKRGVEVLVLADRQQTENGQTSVIGWLVEQGVPVWADADHAAAHNKVMVLDAGTPQAVLITGSFNFTHAAQFRNAENLMVLSGNQPLAEAFAANWRRHRAHSLRLGREHLLPR